MNVVLKDVGSQPNSPTIIPAIWEKLHDGGMATPWKRSRRWKPRRKRFLRPLDVIVAAANAVGVRPD